MYETAGGLASDTQHWIQAVTQNATGFAAVPDGRPTVHARLRLPVGPDDRTVRYSVGV